MLTNQVEMYRDKDQQLFYFSQNLKNVANFLMCNQA